jgi:hypothetical protein
LIKRPLVALVRMLGPQKVMQATGLVLYAAMFAFGGFAFSRQRYLLWLAASGIAFAIIIGYLVNVAEDDDDWQRMLD